MRAPPIGRFLRLALALLLLAGLWPFFRSSGVDRMLPVLGAILGLGFLYGLVHWWVSSRLPGINRCLGACLAVAPVVFLFVSGGTIGRVAVVGFIGVSLLIAAVRADPGCEVMSIPSLVLGQRTHLPCLLFSPLDWVEEKITAAVRSRR